ncbi:MAG: LutB/LldF family L-lactate oxidation iron-sulfur protein [Bacteroidota bacterium]|nr:LutB/LldF family L-lactate oxidation iron-sulfur protein [Bacteroidota bacterium]
MKQGTPIQPEFLDALVRERIHDGTLRGNLRRATQTSLNKRLAVVSDFTDWEEMRQLAYDIKKHVMEHLPLYLSRFEERAREAGAVLHYAATAAEASRIVCDLTAEVGDPLVVKSKSMTTEEIELTPALEQRGFRTVETDLGEYIVQLAQEPPSHITAPALHKSRGEIGALFAEKLGIPYTDDPQELTDIARKILREDFLTAGVGISGVNFAVAESGTLCVVENEGNARLSMSLPKRHIAVMGLEKLLPDFDSLALFLNLLGRSATGQRLTCYTSLITGPRRPDELDGPEDVHIVILDNGRSRMLQDARLREALYCIRCGACMNVCPVYQKIGGHGYGSVYSGPIGSVITPVFRGEERAKKLPYASSLCGACAEICPVKIDIHHHLLYWRARIVSHGHTQLRERLAMRLFLLLARHARLFDAMGRLGRLFAPLFRAKDGGLQVPVWGRERSFPALPEKSFKQLWQEKHEQS